MSSFTKSQSEAIRHVDGPLLVLAGPGSGKTTVVTNRNTNIRDNARGCSCRVFRKK